MPFRDLYSDLPDPRLPVDLARGEAIPKDPDEVVYRKGFSSVQIAGMPGECEVGRVQVFRTVGPVLTQMTLIRQRHGLPIVFDKAMHQAVEVGANEVLTICQIRDEPPDVPGDAFNEWREEANSAIGILAATLDDRIAISERFEDLVNLHKGVPVSSGDTRSRLRTFLPFDVTEDEVKVLAELADLRTSELAPLSEAARWYVKAFQEGPTADAIVYLWIAIESLTPHPTTSPKTVEAMLASAGFNPKNLGEIGVGRLAGLRAEIVHSGARNLPLIRDGYYRLEAIVRVLIRNAAGIRSSWPPALMVSVFGEDAARVTEARASKKIEWNEDGLSYPGEPEFAGLNWDSVQTQFASEAAPMPVTFVGELQPGWRERISHWLSRSAELLEIEFEKLEINVTQESDDVPKHVLLAASEKGLMLRPELLTLPDLTKELRLARVIQEGLAQVAVMRLGIASESLGTLLIAMGGSWAVYRAFYSEDQPLAGQTFPLEGLKKENLLGLGLALGAAVAGSSSAASSLAEFSKHTEEGIGTVAMNLFNEWRDVDDFPELLRDIEEFVELMPDPNVS